MRIFKQLKILLLLVTLAACGRLEGQIPAISVSPSEQATPTPVVALAPAGSFDETLVSGGLTRRYRLHLPISYQPGQPTPLVINFHGLGANSFEQEALSGMSDYADKAGFIVVYPEGRQRKWADGPGAEGEIDRQFVLDLIHSLQSQYTLDPKRIYATGISNGGGMTNRLGCDLAETIAAIAPVAGAYNFWQACQPARPVPVVAFHGTADKVVPYAGTGRGTLAPPIHEWAQAWAERDKCDLSPTVTFKRQDVVGETWSLVRIRPRWCCTPLISTVIVGRGGLDRW